MNRIQWTPDYGLMDLIDDLQEQAELEVEYLRRLNPDATDYQINAYREGYMQGGLAATRILQYKDQLDDNHNS